MRRANGDLIEGSGPWGARNRTANRFANAQARKYEALHPESEEDDEPGVRSTLREIGLDIDPEGQVFSPTTGRRFGAARRGAEPPGSQFTGLGLTQPAPVVSFEERTPRPL